MSVQTEYDFLRDELRDKLSECVKLAVKLTTSEEDGYDSMRKDYAIDVYVAVRNARDIV